MPGFQSSTGSLLVTSTDGVASGAVGSGNKNSRVKNIILNSFRDMFDKMRIIASLNRLCLVFKVHQVPHQ